MKTLAIIVLVLFIIAFIAVVVTGIMGIKEVPVQMYFAGILATLIMLITIINKK